MKDRQHEYMRRLLLACEKGLIDKPALLIASVAHDDDCPKLKGGVCACDPDITINTDDGSILSVQADGTLRMQGVLQ